MVLLLGASTVGLACTPDPTLQSQTTPSRTVWRYLINTWDPGLLMPFLTRSADRIKDRYVKCYSDTLNYLHNNYRAK